MKILVTGATGLIGRRLSELLVDEGNQVVAFSRRPENAKLTSGIKVYRWQPEEGTPPDEAMDGVDALVHLAGESVASARWTDRQKRRIRDSRVLSTRHLVDAIASVTHRPKVLVTASAANFYGINRGDEQLAETSEAGTGFLADVCQAWEKEAIRARDFGLRVAQVRTGVVLSAEGGALKEMLLPFKLGVGGRLGSGRQWFPWIHIDDIIGIFRHALISSSINGPIIGVAPGIVNNQEFTHTLAGVLHRPDFFPVPNLALRILLGEMSELLIGCLRLRPQVALDTGYRFRFERLGPALEDLLGRK
jgi:uncharacterized protein (TIGR01777 family)